MKSRLGDALLLLASLLFMVLIVEGGYRIYLWQDLQAARERHYQADSEPSFGFYGWPPPWRFDRLKGFAFNDGGWPEGRVVKGRFEACAQTGSGNRLGNFGPIRGRYEDAALKIALFGSSYTLIDHARNGDTSANLLQEALTKRLGRQVHVLNFSRDATGLFTMFDIAGEAMKEFRPDLMLFTFNMTALGYRRHWRVVKPVGPHFYRMYFTRDPSEEVRPDNSMVHVNPITPRVTTQWCEEMAQARRNGDEARLGNDPLFKEIVQEYRAIMRERAVPHIAISFWSLERSFVYDKLKKGDPYGGRKVLRDNTAFWEPLSLRSYVEDAQFADALRYVRDSRIPFEIVHLPALPELRRESTNLSGASGLSDDDQRAVLAKVEGGAGRRIIRLLDYYSPENLADPLALVWSKDDSHPSARGVIAMADAIERMLFERGTVSSRSIPSNRGSDRQ